ncbi:ComEC/Rec2 family competence protein [Ruminococcus flavefaciens]|uniref:ComEC/Rec2 family competence protein n=1 Tax=Ruminococcus flavefaciens TaxID=1265 RepID=UPI00156588E1|nr:ComEC/Rec2 family competence protein [Ruminococcus flavefaciens]
MKRKMIGAAAAYMAGLFFASFFSNIPFLVILSMILAAALLVGRKYGFKAGDYLMLSVFFVSAVSVFSICTAVRYKPVVEMVGKEGCFRGEVVEAYRYSGSNSSYILRGRINDEISAKISFYGGELQADRGDIITIGSCIFSKPSKDYLFDSESYYKSDGIFLTATYAEDVTAQPFRTHKLREHIRRYREKNISDFRVALGGDSGDLLAGMVFGEKRGMDDNVRTAVYRCGIGHILAVSGLHVSVAVLVLMLILKRCRVNKYISFAVMEVLLLFLTAMANYPVSAIRAAVMMNFLYGAKLFRRQNDTFNSLAGAVLLICLVSPYSVYDEGFLMSVAGTFGIGVAAPCMTKDMPRDSFLQRAAVSFVTMLCTTLCVFPLSLLYFDETSLISPLSNMILVPLCSVSMIVGLIYALTGGALDLLFVSKLINDLILRISDSLARLRITHFSTDSRTLMTGLIICSVIVFFGFALFRSRRATVVTVTAAVIFMFTGAAVQRMVRNDHVIVAVLGKGNNAAVVVNDKGTVTVADLSGHYRSSAYVRKYLARNSIETVDTVLLSNRSESAFASYVKALEYTKTGKWYAEGAESRIKTVPQLTYLGEDGFTVESSSCDITLSGGALNIKCDDGEVVIEKGGDAVTGALTVIYGKAPQDADEAPDNVIYTDKGNNFEIWFSAEGSFEIRRL